MWVKKRERVGQERKGGGGVDNKEEEPYRGKGRKIGDACRCQDH